MPRWERAGRWIALAVVATVAILQLLSCHGQSASNDDGDDGGDGGPCTCPLTEGNTVVNVVCGATVCAGGTLYLCSIGDTIAEGLCGDASYGGDDGGDGGPSNCVPECNGVSCGGPDMCGGVCGCSQGVDCVQGMCGNGCALLAGSICSEDAGTSDPQACCEQGNLCRVQDSGVPVCCAQTTTKTFQGGLCSLPTDCCDYPGVTCAAEGGIGTCQ